jgi:hypothetical protein
MARKKKTRKRRATQGMGYDFHGAFASKADALAKARRRKGWVVKRWMRGQSKPRYVVLTNTRYSEKVPF